MEINTGNWQASTVSQISDLTSSVGFHEQPFAVLVQWVSRVYADSDSIMSDASHDCSYSELPNLLDRIESHLSAQGASPEGGVILECVNTLPGALTLLALLRANYHVHLTPAGSTSTAKANAGLSGPTFLRHALKMASGLDDDQIKLDDPETFLQCSPNPSYREASGKIFGDSGRLFVKTSGSLGVPKLAVHRPSKLIQNVMRVVERLELGTSDRVCVPVPIFHMYGLGAGFLPAFLAGASIDFQENANLLRYLEREEKFNPNIAFVTPSFCETLLNRRSNRQYRFMVSAGERMSEETFHQVETRFGPVINLYGSTEMGVIAATHRDLPAERRVSTVGTVLPNIEVDLAESSEASTEDGACYELLLKNPDGFECYVDPDGNVLRTDSVAGDGWYKTGDLVQRDGDGLITVLGRNSLSLNRNGYLVVFADIERRMRSFDGLERVALTARPIDDSKSELIAFCEVSTGSELESAGQIRAKCLDALPRFAVPDIIQVLDQMPLLANGKIDRQALKAIDL